jgi:hypothetical protein
MNSLPGATPIATSAVEVVAGPNAASEVSPPAERRSPAPALEREQLDIEKAKLELERAKLALESSFAKKWATSILGLAGVIIAAVLSFAAGDIATKIKESDDQRAREQQVAIATGEAEDRRLRFELDYANFIMANWPTFSKGSNEDRQALIVVTSQFPTFAGSKTMEKLIALFPNANTQGVQDALKQLQPRFDLSGAWRCTAKCQMSDKPGSILQNNAGLILTNEVGSIATGIYKTPTQFAAIQWGDLDAYIQDDGRKIIWQNGSIWEKK